MGAALTHHGMPGAAAQRVPFERCQLSWQGSRDLTGHLMKISTVSDLLVFPALPWGTRGRAPRHSTSFGDRSRGVDRSMVTGGRGRLPTLALLSLSFDRLSA